MLPWPEPGNSAKIPMSEADADNAGSVQPQGPLGELIGELKTRTDRGEEVSIGLIQKIAGSRAAGPMLLLPALIVMSPLSIIPGLPTIVGLNTILVAGQVALGRDHLWLPDWLKHRSLPARHVKKLLRFLVPVGNAADGFVKPRASALTGSVVRRVGAGVCVLVGCIMPMLEVIPFTSTWAASIIALYALAITVKDGFLALAWVALVIAVFSVAWLVFA